MQHLNHEAPKNNRRLLYVCLPRKLATQPPLRHLTPFQLDIACALIAAARGVLADDLHVRALKGGKAAIQTEMKTSTEYFKTRWWADQGRNFAVPPKGAAIKRAGEKGYRSRKKAIRRRPPPAVIPLEVSRSGLLRWAKLAPHGRGLKRLSAALDRLTRPINNQWPAILKAWTQLPSGRLHCQVNGHWIATESYVRVPLPLPRGANAKALYLFLLAIRTTAINKVDIDLASLCERLGIATHAGAWACGRSLDRALELVNKHLHTLPHAALQEARIKVAGQYQIVLQNDRYRFMATARPEPDDDHVEMKDLLRDQRAAKLAEINERIRNYDRQLERSSQRLS